jgi:hypothetical protein
MWAGLWLFGLETEQIATSDAVGNGCECGIKCSFILELAKSVAGVVNDPSGAALPGVTVEERSEDWKTVLRSTETDGSGRLQFSSTRNKTIYYLQFSLSGFNELRIKLQLDKKVNVPIVVNLPIAT